MMEARTLLTSANGPNHENRYPSDRRYRLAFRRRRRSRRVCGRFEIPDDGQGFRRTEPAGARPSRWRNSALSQPRAWLLHQHPVRAAAVDSTMRAELNDIHRKQTDGARDTMNAIRKNLSGSLDDGAAIGSAIDALNRNSPHFARPSTRDRRSGRCPQGRRPEDRHR